MGNAPDGDPGGGTIRDAQVGRRSLQSQQTLFSGKFIRAFSLCLNSV